MTTTATPRKRAARKHVPTVAVPKRSQGFYRDPETGDKLRSVTTILNQGVPKEALIFWAGNIVAASAMSTLPALVKASRDPRRAADAYDYLRRAHTRKKEERGDAGSAVHKLIEHHILGTPVPQDLLDNEEVAPLLPHFHQCVEDWQITFEASEMVVANPDDGWAGTLDYLMRSPFIDGGSLQMGDTKTGGEICAGDKRCLTVDKYRKGCDGVLHTIKGVYAESGLQMSAYRKAKVAWLRDGTKVPMPETHGGVILQLRPEGYLLIPARCDDDVYATFLHAKQVAEWTSSLSKNVVGDALVLPTEQKASA